MKRLLNATAVVVASSLLLAACGGGSDDETVTPTPPPTTTPEEPMPDTSAAYESAMDAEDGAADAAMAAAGLLQGATKAAGELAVGKVNGDSRMAYDNAMTVLGTTALIEAERGKAAAAVMMIEGIDQTGLSDQQMARIGRALTDAKASHKAIEDILNGESLMMAVETVNGESMIGASDSKIAQDYADRVAMAMMAAIDDAEAASPDSSDDAVMVSPNSGHTFEEIAGSPTMAVNTLKDFKIGDDAAVDLGAATASGTTQTASYMGITGSLLCVTPGGCSVADGKIKGSVQFLPASPTTLYHKTTFGGDYVPLTNVGYYGYWLSSDDSIARHVKSLRNTEQLLWNRGEAKENVKATYDGMVGGYSYRMTGDDKKMTASGEFTADIDLTATFKETGSASLSGTVSGFAPKDGSAGTGHVNGNWQVALTSEGVTDAGLTNGGVESTDHTYRTGEVGATDGSWTAEPYGEDGKHPTGFVGAFDATFGDEGAAVGVYQADRP